MNIIYKISSILTERRLVRARHFAAMVWLMACSAFSLTVVFQAIILSLTSDDGTETPLDDRRFAAIAV